MEVSRLTVHLVIRGSKYLWLHIVVLMILVGCVEFNDRLDYKLIGGSFTTPDGEYAFKTSKRRFSKKYHAPTSRTKHRSYVELDNLAVVIIPIEANLLTLYTWPHTMQIEFKKNTAYFETTDGTKYPLTFYPTYSSNTIRTKDSVSTGITRSGGRNDYDQNRAFYLPVGASTEQGIIIPPTEDPYRIYIPFELDDEVYEIDIVVEIVRKLKIELVSPVFTGNP